MQTIVLALLQGLTEILPISSSAHLILVPAVLDWPDQGLTFDIAVHTGTLIAVLSYFRREVRTMLIHWYGSLTGRGFTTEACLAWTVLISTLPALVVGFLFKDVVEHQLRSVSVIALTLMLFALLLWWSDANGARQRNEYTLNWREGLVIGLAQALALIPGTSRSGVTMTAGLMIGLTRRAAARFSFLLSIPTIAGPGLLLVRDLVTQPAPAHWPTLLLGGAVAGVTTYLCIHFFLQLLERIGMLPFVLYRLALGLVLLVFFV